MARNEENLGEDMGFVPPFEPRNFLIQNRYANHSTVTLSTKLNYASTLFHTENPNPYLTI
jgi:hypothetical protein